MREMKNSGIEWIGEIPVGWEIIRMKNAIFSREAGAWGDEKVGNENDVICLRIADFDYQRLRFKEKNELTIRNYKPEVINKLLLKKGDILIEKSGGGEKTPVGRAVIFDKDYNALFANFLERLRTKNTVDTYYFLYILTAFYQNKHMVIYIKQTTGIQNLDITSMINFEYLPFPPLEEQHRISIYLDTKCEKIDSIIARQQEVIEKLKAYKLSVITEAVTKGLNPDVRMKDSGVEWIGNVPEHWEICKFKFLGKFVNGYAFPSSAFKSVGVRVMKIANIQPMSISWEDESFVDDEYLKLTNYLVCKGDLVFALTRPIINGGIKVAIADNTEKVLLNQRNAMFKGQKQITTKWQYYLMQNNMFVQEFALYIDGTGQQPNISTNEIANIPIPVPAISEQQQIADYLDKKCSAINSAIAKKQAIIEKLTAYKKSLIYEVVTGKREV